MHDRPARRTLRSLDVALLLREVRVLAGLSQAELAARIGAHQPAVSRWERGVETPRLETIAAILEACGYEADVVCRRHDDVDRAQIAGSLAQTPDERLETVANVNELLGLARAG